MPGSTNDLRRTLIGRWSKLGTAACGRMYPDAIEFFPGGTYRGRRGVRGDEFTLWDAGSWEVIDESHVKISTANDAEIEYGCRVTGETMTFVDEAGCEFGYQRARRASHGHG